jgi:UDP-N-acetylmuramoyl-tripeptide--D-alanyl-D-alanine ligase
MLELGPSSSELHRESGRAAAESGKLDWMVGVQGDAESFIRGAIDAGHPSSNAKFFATSTDAAGFVADLAGKGDVLLVKGSRGVKMERIVEALDARFPRSGSVPEAQVGRGAVKERG